MCDAMSSEFVGRERFRKFVYVCNRYFSREGKRILKKQEAELLIDHLAKIHDEYTEDNPIDLDRLIPIEAAAKALEIHPDVEYKLEIVEEYKFHHSKEKQAAMVKLLEDSKKVEG